MKKYDYLIVGAGLFGAVFANEATRAGRKCLVIDRRNHVIVRLIEQITRVKDIVLK